MVIPGKIGALDGMTARLRSAWIRQRGGQLVKRCHKIRFLYRPGDRSCGLSDHPKAGVGGDADVGEAQDEGYGHVDQAASSAVTSHPYRSDANAR